MRSLFLWPILAGCLLTSTAHGRSWPDVEHHRVEEFFQYELALKPILPLDSEDRRAFMAAVYGRFTIASFQAKTAPLTLGLSYCVLAKAAHDLGQTTMRDALNPACTHARASLESPSQSSELAAVVADTQGKMKNEVSGISPERLNRMTSYARHIHTVASLPQLYAADDIDEAAAGPIYSIPHPDTPRNHPITAHPLYQQGVANLKQLTPAKQRAGMAMISYLIDRIIAEPLKNKTLWSGIYYQPGGIRNVLLPAAISMCAQGAIALEIGWDALAQSAEPFCQSAQSGLSNPAQTLRKETVSEHLNIFLRELETVSETDMQALNKSDRQSLAELVQVLYLYVFKVKHT